MTRLAGFTYCELVALRDVLAVRLPDHYRGDTPELTVAGLMVAVIESEVRQELADRIEAGEAFAAGVIE